MLPNKDEFRKTVQETVEEKRERISRIRAIAGRMGGIRSGQVRLEQWKSKQIEANYRSKSKQNFYVVEVPKSESKNGENCQIIYGLFVPQVEANRSKSKQNCRKKTSKNRASIYMIRQKSIKSSLEEEDNKKIKSKTRKLKIKETETLPLFQNLTPEIAPESQAIEPVKKKYLDYVYLTDSEYEEFFNQNGEEVTQAIIQRLNDYLVEEKNPATRYRSHAAAIRKWVRKAIIVDTAQINRALRDSGVGPSRREIKHVTEREKVLKKFGNNGAQDMLAASNG